MPRVSAAHEQQIRERIVHAALHVFADRGFHRATMQDVVRESGLSVGAIYTYFSGKDELFLASCDMSSGQGFDELGNRLTRGETVAERLAIAVAFFLDSVVESKKSFADPPRMLIQAWAEAEQEPAVREMLIRRREQLNTTARLLLQEGIARGEVPAWLDVDAAASAATALLDGLLLQQVEAGAGYRRRDFERRARVLVELVLAANGSARPALPVVAPEPFNPIEPVGPHAHPDEAAS
jgi:AcrR family transcriptional regulator